MPHVEIHCFSGRTDEQKTLCAEKIVEVIADTLGCKTSSVSVAIKDVPEDQWKEKVWDAHITPDEALGAIALPGLKGKVKRARRLSDGFEMRMLTPWVAKEFPDCEFMNYSIPDCFSFTVEKTPVEVIEFELKEDQQ